MQLLRELIHGPLLRMEEVEDFAPRGFEQPLSPAIYFIDSKIMRIPSKPKECLTTSSADSARRRSLFAEEGMTLCF